MRQALEQVHVPGEDEARDHARARVLDAFAERETVGHPRRSRWAVVAVAAVLIVALLALIYLLPRGGRRP